MSQASQIYDYIVEHGSIDPVRAWEDLKIMRLGARVFDLKAAGLPIVTEIKYGKNGTRWAEYSLAKE